MRRTVRAFRNEGLLYDQSVTEQRNYQFHWLSEVSWLFRALPWEERVEASVKLLLDDPNIEVHLDQMFLKPAGGVGCGTRWHQDNGYFRVADPLKGTGMWIAIDDATVESGTLHVVPGSHLAPTLPHRRDGGVHQLITCEDEIDEAQAVPCELQAGGVVFFCYGLAHCTMPNFSPTERSGVAYHFVSSDHIHTDWVTRGARQEQHRQLSGPTASGGVREYGAPQGSAVAPGSLCPS